MIKEEIVKLTFPYSDKREKVVRVFIPAHEEGETFPVVYMTDGQNLFDEETSSFGSWLTREAVREEQSANGRGAIIVGIHNDGSPLDRNNDLTPAGIGKVDGFFRRILAFPRPAGEAFARFAVETVKPEIESRFPVKKGRENTAFCGSSSGGLESFFIAMTYPEIFSYAGVISPAFCLYSEKDMRKWIERKVRKDIEMPFLYIYTGRGDKREKEMWDGEQKTFAILRECYPQELLKEVLKPEALHNEAAWQPVFREFLHLFLSR